MQRIEIGWTGFLMLALALSLAGPAYSEERRIADFENPVRDALAATADRRSECAVSAEFASQGQHSLRMTFQGYRHGLPQWPNCKIEFGDLDAPRDWRGFDELLIDLHVQSEAGVLVKMVLRSAGEGRWVGSRKISPGEWTTIRLPLWLAAASGLDPGAMESVALVLTRPPHPAVIHLDNIRVRSLELSDPRSIEWFLTTPSYHRGFFHTKPENRIVARWECRSTPGILRESELLFRLERNDGTEIASKTVAGDDASTAKVVSFPKPEMSDGEEILLRMEVRQEKRLLWDKSMTVTQYPPGRREVTLRDDGVTLIDGKPFFPLGMYGSPVTELSKLREMGFNAAHSYSPVNAAYMKAAEAAGMFVLPRMKGNTKRGSHIYHDPDLDDAVALKYVRSLKDSPALLGYYLFDEPNPGDYPRDRVLALCDWARRADPYHLAAGCNNSFQKSYYQVSDAMMVDNYPIPGPLDGLITDMRDGAAAQSPNRALWFIPQAFNYETHFTTTLEERRHGFRRAPTFDEIRTMPWLSIVLGARGLFYYNFQTQGFYLRDAFPWFWRGFEHHIREVAMLLPWLTERTAVAMPSCDNEKVHIAAWQRGKDLLVVAANADLEAVETTLTVPGLAGRVLHVLSENRTVRLDGDTFREKFKPLETHIYITSAETGMMALATLDDIRAEVNRMEKAFREENPSLFTYRDGGRLHASWEFPDPETVDRKVWYRMIDGYPGTQWVVGNKYSKANIPGWTEKDFTSAGRWIEVRGSKPKEINRIRAILTPDVSFDLQVSEAGRWRTVKGEPKRVDPPRHHRYPSATTTASFEPVETDRFRIVFPEPAKENEVIFELAAWKQQNE